ncbi:MAG TPA: FG-GAP-like repeat-containing protein, partial [Candidatus Solibacter sp.]|nr:FG-GAP-like repeat-containing protein [Candidatus Solibacter sp.]
MAAFAAGALAWILSGQSPRAAQNELWQHRNLGKAFYENPTTQKQAVEEFRKALALAPDSIRERINYGVALLRAGDAEAGIAELRKAQQSDPRIPHTWFNLGIQLKKQGDLDAALPQFQGMVRLVPDEPVTHYQIGSILKSRGDTAAAIKEFEAARRLNRLLAAPHFQLYGLYRQANRSEDAAAELRTFQDLKKQQEGAAVPEDMEWSFYAEIYDPTDADPGPPLSPPVYRSERIAGGFDGVAAIALDGVHPSLVAWSAQKVALFRGGRTVVADTGLEALRNVISITPGDFDNDGLPDLCVITNDGAALYRNVNGKFRKHTDVASGKFRTALWLDYDHDYDLDLFLLGDDSKLMRNNGAAGFSDETKRFPFVAGHVLSATRFDLEPDTPGMDLIVSYADRAGVRYRDRLAGAYEAVPLTLLPSGATHLQAIDFNHDGRTDLAASPKLLLLNRGTGFEKAGFEKAAFEKNDVIEAATSADFSGTGRLSRARIAEGALYLDRDTNAAYGNWIEVALTGVKNLKTAIGAKVEVKAGTSYEKQTYEGVPLVFRLGTHTRVDTVRITWPNGLIQNELNQPINRIASIREAPRLSGSCPMIFTWNGERFVFITDVLGVAPLGASSGDGHFFPVDHDEYVSIPGDLLKQRDGAYEVRVTEELHEVSYLDQIKLVALDHPAATEIITNEKFKSPPFPEFRLFGGERRIYATSAHDDQGNDVRGRLRAHDFTYPDAFHRNSAGVAEMHHLDLDFGKAAASNHAVLVLYGWVDWADGSTFLAATQERRDLVFPYLQVKDRAGNWKTVVEDMGIPSGKPKAMAVDLAGKFLSDSREVRIVTNLCVYWDEIYLLENDSAPTNRMMPVRLHSADLHFRGFSRPAIHPERKQPEQFDYQIVSPTSMWNPTPGNYTRYGDVADLLREPDDRMVIMGSGDEVTLRFDGKALPPLPTDWKRDFLLLVDGWAKDADANTAYSQSVLPLPFHGMTSYPYPAGQHFPDDAMHQEYQREYNTRPALKLMRGLSGAGPLA